MGAASKICRLCVQIIGEDVPYSALTDNNIFLRKLNLLSSSVAKNIRLTENPLICKTCENRLKELANFKETVAANEEHIGKANLKAFLQTLSEDFNAICRLCLKVSKKKGILRKNWLDRNSLLSECNIDLNVNIAAPVKICDICDVTLQKIRDFVSQCSDNDKRIVRFAAKKGKALVSEDLLRIFSPEGGTLKKSKTEDINNVLRKSKNDSSKNKRVRRLNEKLEVQNEKTKKETASASNKGGQSHVNKNNSILKYMTKKETQGDKVMSEEESFNITRTPNTYKKKKPVKKYNRVSSAEMPSTSRGSPSMRNILDRKYILKKMNEQLRQMHTSIDASPLLDVTDITLDVDSNGLVQEEAISECNATQELIDVLEGRLNDRDINYATQELLDVLEGRLDDEALVGTVEIETGPKKKDGRPQKLPPAVESKNPSPVNSTASSSNKRENVVEIVAIPNKKEPKPSKDVESASREKRQDLKQKTIIMSFKNMRDVKTLKSKETQNDASSNVSESPKEAVVVKKNLKKTSGSNSDRVSDVVAEETNKAATEKLGQSADKDAAPKNPKAPRKRTVKTKENADKTSPPQKRSKKAPMETAPVNNTFQSASEIGSSKEVPENVQLPSEAEVNRDADELAEDKRLDNREVTVTIIKGKKRTNKAQLDKTWQELTGNNPVAANERANRQSEVQHEFQYPKKRRGRPPLPDNLKKSQKIKREVKWLYCELCPFKTYAQKSFVQHHLIHNVMSSVPTLDCDVCCFKTTNAELLEQHKLSHNTPDLSFKCIFCDIVFKKKVSCMYHTLRHDDKDVANQFYCTVFNAAADEEYFECYQCDYTNVEESAMPDHVIDHTIQRPRNPLVAKFKCDWCPYRTKSEDLLKRHKDLHDEKSKTPVVKKEAPTITIKKEPEDGNESQNEGEIPPPLLNCDQCLYVTRNKRSLANHRGIKHNRRSVLPATVGAAATAKAIMEGLPIYYCNECSYRTYRKLNMPRHALVHRTKENMEFFECPHCIFETKHRRSYTRHLEVVHAVLS